VIGGIFTFSNHSLLSKFGKYGKLRAKYTVPNNSAIMPPITNDRLFAKWKMESLMETLNFIVEMQI
jgi:hypothetical protein